MRPLALEPFPANPRQEDSALRLDVACWLADMEARHGTRLQSDLPDCVIRTALRSVSVRQAATRFGAGISAAVL